MAVRDYSLPQGCPAELEPHFPNACGDPEHAMLALSDEAYAALKASAQAQREAIIASAS